jgi:glycosyltransferase involved in cell wall biosynthesis
MRSGTAIVVQKTSETLIKNKIMDTIIPAKQKVASSFRPILGHYLLVTFCIPFYVDEQGRRYLDSLWVKDLIEHFRYLKNFTLASPCRYENPPEGSVLLDSDPAFANVQFIDLPAASSTIDALRLLPRTISKLWKAVESADVVHTGIAGWPIPEGWFLTPIVRLRRKFYLIIVESAFWRLAPSSPKSLKLRIRAYIVEQVNRWCVNNANLAIFTQDQYRCSLMTRNPERGHVINASWIDEKAIISHPEAIKMWNQKVQDVELRVLFAGRLTPAKGILVLLEAMQLLSIQGISVKLDILGQGELLEKCQKVSQDIKLPVQIQILGTVPYGTVFFNLLRKYHAIVIPTVSDEQPRIIYDAYSQGIPVLASSTNGNRNCVQDGETGKFIPPNDPVALADLLKWASQNPDQLAKMGLKSIDTALSLTHAEMHRRRWDILLTTLDESQIVGSSFSASIIDKTSKALHKA